VDMQQKMPQLKVDTHFSPFLKSILKEFSLAVQFLVQVLQTCLFVFLSFLLKPTKLQLFTYFVLVSKKGTCSDVPNVCKMAPCCH
jgi:hypothetical protein